MGESKPIIETLVVKAKDPKSRSLTNILGGGTVAGLLLWEHPISSATVLYIATEIWVLFTIIAQNWIARALLCIIAVLLLNFISLALVSVFTVFYVEKWFREQYLSKVEEDIGREIEQLPWVGQAEEVVDKCLSWFSEDKSDTIKKRINKVLEEALWSVYQSALRVLANFVEDYLPALIHSETFQELLQMLLMISEGSHIMTFFGVVASLQAISIMCIFFPPTTVLYIGYLCMATLPALFNKYSKTKF